MYSIPFRLSKNLRIPGIKAAFKAGEKILEKEGEQHPVIGLLVGDFLSSSPASKDSNLIRARHNIVSPIIEIANFLLIRGGPG